MRVIVNNRKKLRKVEAVRWARKNWALLGGVGALVGLLVWMACAVAWGWPI